MEQLDLPGMKPQLPTIDAVEVPDGQGNMRLLVMSQLLCERVRPGAILPAYANGPHLDNGVDLYVCEDVVIRPGETVPVPTGWKMGVPLGWGLLILPRSGTSLRTTLRIANSPGLIDHGYRDEVQVLVWNAGSADVTVGAGNRIAQAVLVSTPVLVPEEVPCIGGPNRGGGLGSTGNE